MGPLVAGTVEKVIAAVFRDKGGGGLLRSVRDWLESSVLSEVEGLEIWEGQGYGCSDDELETGDFRDI